MASKKTIRDIFDMLKENWPKQPYTKRTVDLYWRCLGDIDDDILKAATVQCVTTRTFWPRIAELRQAAFDIMCNKAGLPTAYEAWGMVDRHRKRNRMVLRDGCLYKKVILSEPIERAVRAMGGWDRLGNSDNYSADRARFIEAYEALATKQSDARQALPEVRQLAERLAMGGRQREIGII